MLLVLLLSYVNLFQRTLLLSPRGMFHFRFILESGCKSTNFTTNFQIFFKKSFRKLQKLIYIKPVCAHSAIIARLYLPYSKRRLSTELEYGTTIKR